MIEERIIGYLSGKTQAGSEVHAERPRKIPSKYILIEKTGSSTENMITTSTIAIQSIVDSLQKGRLLDAMALNDEVKEVMRNLVEEDDIIACSLNSDYNFTDDSTKEYRYQAIFLVTHY